MAAELSEDCRVPARVPPAPRAPARGSRAPRLSPGRHQVIDECIQGLVRRDARLSPSQLATVTSTLAARRDLWEDLVVHSPDDRWYLPLYRSATCDVWLLAWQPDQETDWHDHGGSSGSFAVAEGALVEKFRTAGGQRVRTRLLNPGRCISFGPAHVHDVAHGGGGPAASIHAYSPPLVTMTYYERTPAGLVATETVVVESAEGPRREAGITREERTRRPTAARVSSAMRREAAGRSDPPVSRPLGGGTEFDGLYGIDEVLSRARVGLDRLSPRAAFEAVSEGAVLVDIRPVEQRREEGEVPGAVIISRNVLEWRLDPRSEARIEELARFDAQIIVFCSEGYASSLAAVSLRELGLTRATDVVGGFRDWVATGLPATGLPAAGLPATGLPPTGPASR